jgi:hypothetical protein
MPVDDKLHKKERKKRQSHKNNNCDMKIGKALPEFNEHP